jgi:phosphatidate cytidylyltransferase
MMRLASAAVLIVVLLTTIWLLPPWVTAVLAAGVAAAASGEFARLAGRLGGEAPTGFVSLAAATIVISSVIPWPAMVGVQAGSLTSVLLAVPVAAGLLTLALGPPEPATFLRASVMTMAPIYVGLPLGALTWIHWTWGPAATTWLLATIVISDSAQYYTGRAFGRRKLAPVVSPGKTVEGAVGGLVAVAISGMILAPLCLPGVGVLAGGLLAAGIAAFGLAGDLFESALKRSVGVKDSSDLIPGHGGVLDRIDAYLFAAPVFYLVVRHLV